MKDNTYRGYDVHTARFVIDGSGMSCATLRRKVKAVLELKGCPLASVGVEGRYVDSKGIAWEFKPWMAYVTGINRNTICVYDCGRRETVVVWPKDAMLDYHINGANYMTPENLEV